MRKAFGDLGDVLNKYTQVSKKIMDFGVGEPLYPAEIHMISAVAEEDGICLEGLRAKFGTTKGAASQLVAKLADRGYLQKAPDPEKRSRLIIKPTEKGRKVHEGHMAFHQEHDKEFLDYLTNLSPQEYRVFEELCSRMNLWMDSYLE